MPNPMTPVLIGALVDISGYPPAQRFKDIFAEERLEGDAEPNEAIF
jgi:hypothetical protein